MSKDGSTRYPERYEALPEDEELTLCTLAHTLSDRMEGLAGLPALREDHGVSFLIDNPNGLSLGRFAEGGLILEDSAGASVRGLGSGLLLFTSGTAELPPALIVGLHTDAPTRARAEKLARVMKARRLPPPKFETAYHFTHDGEIAKYATFPVVLPDGRPDLTLAQLKADFLAGSKVVRSRINRSEYRMVGFALTGLNVKLKEALERLGQAS